MPIPAADPRRRRGLIGMVDHRHRPDERTSEHRHPCVGVAANAHCGTGDPGPDLCLGVRNDRGLYAEDVAAVVFAFVLRVPGGWLVGAEPAGGTEKLPFT